MSDDFNRVEERERPRWFPSGHCSLLATDIASSGSPERTDDVLHRLRNSLYDLIKESLAGAGVPFGRCYWEDRGDGVIIIAPPDADTSVLVSPLVEYFRHGLDQYNQLSSEIAQIRLRVALHAGEVSWDGRGLVGTAVNHVFRLLDAPALKAALSEPAACLAFIASARVHEDVIRHGRGMINRGDYQPAGVRVKETVTTGWIRVLRTSAKATYPVAGTEVVPRAQPAAPVMASTADGQRTPLPSAQGMPGIMARQVPPTMIFEMVESFLDVPVVADTRGREQLVLALRKEIAAVIPRFPEARMDVWSILRTCLDFPAGLADLMDAVRLFAGDSLAVCDLERVVARLISGLSG